MLTKTSVISIMSDSQETQWKTALFITDWNPTDSSGAWINSDSVVFETRGICVSKNEERLDFKVSIWQPLSLNNLQTSSSFKAWNKICSGVKNSWFDFFAIIIESDKTFVSTGLTFICFTIPFGCLVWLLNFYP